MTGKSEEGQADGLSVYLLGTFRLRLAGKEFSREHLRLHKARDIFSLLSLAADHRLHREQVMETLWPDIDPKAAANRLYYTLHAARRTLEPSGLDPQRLLVFEDGFLRLCPAYPLWIDVEAFESAASRAHQGQDPLLYQAALVLYTGDLLPEDLYEEWTSQSREALRKVYLELALDLGRLHEAKGEWEAASAAFQRVLSIDPAYEGAHVGLMRVYTLSGQRQQALRQYQLLQKSLRIELGAEPDLQSIHLYNDIVTGQILSQGEASKILPPLVATADGTPKGKQPSSLHNLPVQLTSFIGRDHEIVELRSLLKKKDTRLLTLTGSGGTGKTRLALQVAAGLLDAFPDGVWLVQLAPLADPSLIPQTVISALGLIEQAGKSPAVYLSDYLHSKQLLLILDNCEHLVAACAELACELLQSAPRLTILATSREILGVDGEIPFRVPPLGMPDFNHLPLLEGLSRFDAVRLFVERARVVSPGFALTAGNAADVVQITQRLDGIPLALELAAARLRLLSVNQIALRLDDAFRLLTGGSRTAVPRHQTLRALIDWSYDLLSEEERKLLRSLSVFAGSWTLEAAEEVCASEHVAAQDILDLLGSLADKSLILAVQTLAGEIRYRMLETIRQFAHTRLVEAGEAEAIRSRHLDYYLHRAETVEPKLRSHEQIPTLDYWEGELDNLRLALEWALQSDFEVELRLAASLQWFWHIRCHWGEAISWLEQGLAAESLSRNGKPLTGPQAVIRAKALTALGTHLEMRDWFFPVKAIIALEEAVALYRASDPENRGGLAGALLKLGECIFDSGDPLQARVLAEEALSLFRESDDQKGMFDSLRILAYCEIDPAKQKNIYQEMLAIGEADEDITSIATARMHIGFAAYIDGDYASAYAALAASQDQYRRSGNPDAVARGSFFLAKAAIFNGDLERAALLLDEALAGYREMASEGQVVNCLLVKCQIVFTLGSYDQVAELNEEVVRIARKRGDMPIITDVLYQRARLARLRGETAAARQYAEEGLKAGHDLGNEKMHLLLELGYLALQDGDLARAGALCREGLQVLIHWRIVVDMNMILDGLAVLAVRQGKMEHAARLFGTRLWRGWAHALSPIERAERDADFAAITTALGAEHFAQLREEGFAMPFMQVLALAQGEN